MRCRHAAAMAGWPESIEAVLLDLDGVITDTAALHARAWKRMFDDYLRAAGGPDARFEPFDEHRDYPRYVDGKPRYEGARSFLVSRGLDLPFGAADDPPGNDTVCGLSNRKNMFFQDLLRQGDVPAFEDAIAQVRRWRSAGLKIAVVSSSRNCAAILDAAGLTDLFDIRVDGEDAWRLGMRGKPDPEPFLEAARRLGVLPGHAVVVEDAVAGVQAGRRGGFAWVVGVDRCGAGAALAQAGADVVIRSLDQLASAPCDGPASGGLI